MTTTWRRDIYNNGHYCIQGTVNELGVKGVYRVRLFDRQTAQLVRETWSNNAGNYVFNWLPHKPAGFFAVAHDHGLEPSPYAGIMDYISPEQMTTFPDATFAWRW